MWGGLSTNMHFYNLKKKKSVQVARKNFPALKSIRIEVCVIRLLSASKRTPTSPITQVTVSMSEGRLSSLTGYRFATKFAIG